MATSKTLLVLLLFSIPLFAKDPVYKELEGFFHGRGDGLKHKVIRQGDNTVGVHLYLSQPFGLDTLTRSIQSMETYRDWLLTGVNDKPMGGKYRVQLTDLKLQDAAKKHIGVSFQIVFPFYTYKGTRTFEFKITPKKDRLDVDAFTIKPSAGPVGMVRGTGRFYKVGPERIWGYVKGTARLNSSLLYEAMPERMISNEVKDRIPIFIDNYFKEESRLRRKKKPLNTVKTPQKKR